MREQAENRRVRHGDNLRVRLRLTSDRAAPGDHLPQDQSHGVNVGLLEGLNVFQIDPGLQDFGGHVPGGAHLGKQRGDDAANK